MTDAPKRWQFLDTRELLDSSEVVYHWPMDQPERFCSTSYRAVHPIPGDRCITHGAANQPCVTELRFPPECPHTHLSPNHPSPHCSECGQNGEDVTAEVAAWLTGGGRASPAPAHSAGD